MRPLLPARCLPASALLMTAAMAAIPASLTAQSAAPGVSQQDVPRVSQRAPARIDLVASIDRIFNTWNNTHGPGCAVGVAREGPVEIALVDRRGAAARHGGGEVGRGQDNQPAPDVPGLDAADQVAEPDLAFPFVAMVTGHQHQARAVAVANPADRHLDLVVGRAVDRIGEAEEADLLAVFGPGDVGEGACMHRKGPLDRWPVRSPRRGSPAVG